MPRWIDLQKLGFIWLGWFIFTVLSVCLGLFFLYTLPDTSKWLGVFFIAGGMMTGVIRIRRLFWQLVTWLPTRARKGQGVGFWRELINGPRIVVIGGGTGLGTILRGLKKLTADLTAVVTVADDGGSSGRLRQEFGILPPGDIRNCLIAMADLEPLMEQLMQYRFNGDNWLSGHNFGNLFLAAMTGITGDFERAIEASSQVLAVRGRVFPATLENVNIYAELDDGSVVNGESTIGHSHRPIRRVFLDPPDAVALPKAVKAIHQADIVLLGPGSLYTSVIPPLLVKDITEALRRTRAPKVYVCNVMTEPGETTGYTASRHLQAIIEHTGGNLINYVIINDQEVPEKAREIYAREGAAPVVVDKEEVSRLGSVAITAPLLQANSLVRHDASRLARLLTGLLRATAKRDFSIPPFQKARFRRAFTRWRRLITGVVALNLRAGETEVSPGSGSSRSRPVSLPFASHKIEGRSQAGCEVYLSPPGGKDLPEGIPALAGVRPEETVYIAIYLGKRPTGGYKITPVSVSLEKSRLSVKYKEEHPATASLVTQAFSYPALLITVEKRFLPAGKLLVVFQEEGKKRKEEKKIRL
ncbi:MAG TPA: uridine diphosphate-N-acetylglucosamine-binding protein YvcK [Firmicutes bacterium]|jgi:uncharacterized cofD-like protein|nr:uridine diphosphate-N-acetylglucosamine-binding protein YvcK [Bacillota bacterium]